MEDPSSSPEAFFINIFVTISILAGAAITVIETIPKFRSEESDIWWFGIESVVVFFFTMELFARCYGYSDSWKRFRKFVMCKACLFLTDK